MLGIRCNMGPILEPWWLKGARGQQGYPTATQSSLSQMDMQMEMPQVEYIPHSSTLLILEVADCRAK